MYQTRRRCFYGRSTTEINSKAIHSNVMNAYNHVYEDSKIFLRRLQWYLEKQSGLSNDQKSFHRIIEAEIYQDWIDLIIE